MRSPFLPGEDGGAEHGQRQQRQTGANATGQHHHPAGGHRPVVCQAGQQQEGQAHGQKLLRRLHGGQRSDPVQAGKAAAQETGKNKASSRMPASISRRMASTVPQTSSAVSVRSGL